MHAASVTFHPGLYLNNHKIYGFPFQAVLIVQLGVLYFDRSNEQS